MASIPEIVSSLRAVSQDVEDAVKDLQILGQEQDIVEYCLELARQLGKFDKMMLFEMMAGRIEEQRLECAEYIGEKMKESDELRKMLHQRQHFVGV